MRIDVGNALATVATPGVPRDSLDELDTRVPVIHDRITEGMRAESHGYAALRLPERTDPDAIEAAVSRLPDHEHVLLVGIGGSALGAATMVDALGTGDALSVLDNVDPVHTATVLDEAPLADSILFVVSRSGKTTETMANAAVVTHAMDTAGVDWADRTLVITGDEGPLRDLATEHDLATLSTPDGVPGRYSALSSMGLPVAAAMGHDIQEILAGGRDAVDSLGPSLYDSPAYAFGAVSYALAERGMVVNAMMPYAERLETFAEWFAQLWAESLGKDGVGQVPARALGATDQHSQLQLYRAGPPCVQTSFLAVRNLDGVTVPANPPIDPGAELRGRDLGAILETERTATEASLADAGRPNVRLEIDALDERAVGDLLTSMDAACIMAGELFDITPFDQPAVEWSKRAMRGLLRGEETAETATIRDKHECWIDPQ